MRNKESLYGPFLEKVAFPSIRIVSILLAALAIGLGSWIETNDTMGNCSFKSSMSMHQVFLYRNISSNLTTPDSVSFGLWKHCYMYALNCSCTPATLKYQPDVSTVLQTATTNLAVPPLTTTTSLSRVIPLMMATVFCGMAFFIGLWANRRGKYIYRKIIVGFLIATLILLAYAFGSTYNQYYKDIMSTCRSPTNTVYCASESAQIEVILFSIALVLLFIGLIFWFIVSNIFKAITPEEEEEEEEEDLNAVEEKFAVSQWNFRKSATPQQKKRNQSNSEQDLTEQQNNDLAVWRDAAMLDEDYYDNNSNDWEEQHQQYINDPFNNPLPLQQQQQQRHYNHHSNNPHYRQQQKMKKENQQRRSSGMMRNERQQSSSLTPPPHHKQPENYYSHNSPISPNARGNNKSRVTSSGYNSNNNNNRKEQQQRRSSANYATQQQPDYYNKPSHKNRKESNDSVFTFGASGAGYQQQQQQRNKRRSSGRPLSELEPVYQQQQQQQQQHQQPYHTPTSISPHPFQYPPTQSRNSFALTPYYEEPLVGSSGGGYSSGGSSSTLNNQGYFQQQQPDTIPTLNMPPMVQHPLNKKKIKDKRIQSYLNTTTPTTTSSSSSP